MKKLLIAALFSASLAHAHGDGPKKPPEPPAAQAAAVSRDTWAGAPAHVAVSALAGLACSTQIYPKEPLKAFGCAMVPGVLKEVLDSQQKGNRWSNKDIAADALGAATGVITGGLMLSYNERTKTTTVAISIPLK